MDPGGTAQPQQHPQPQLPSILWQGEKFADNHMVFETDEDSALHFRARADGRGGFSFSGRRGQLDRLSVSAAVGHGELCVRGAREGEADVCLDGLSLDGDAASVAGRLSTLLYRPNADFYGLDTLDLAVTVEGTSTTARRLWIRVEAINDRPLLSIAGRGQEEEAAGAAAAPHPLVFATLTSYEDSTLDVVGLSVRDADCHDGTDDGTDCILELRVETERGTPAVQEHFGALLIDKTDGGTSLLLKGDDEFISQALASLVYTPADNFYGRDYLTVKVSDYGVHNTGLARLATERLIHIDVESVPDPPIIDLPVVPTGFYPMKEDLQGVISGISIQDLDCTGSERSELYDVTLASQFGMIRLPLLDRSSAEYDSIGAVNGTFTRSIRVRADIDNIKAILREVVYLGDLNFNGMDALAVSATDIDGLSATAELSLRVEAGNDAPVITVVGERRDTTRSTGDGLSLQRKDISPMLVVEDEVTLAPHATIRDVDLAEKGDLVDIVINVQRGTVKLKDGVVVQRWMLELEHLRQFRQTIHFQANLWRTNQAMDHLHYQPPSNFAGNDTLKITVSDIPKPGFLEQPPLFDVATIPIVVLDQEDHPSLVAPNVLEVYEDIAMLIQPSIYISHVDSEDRKVRVGFECNGGTLSIISHGLQLHSSSHGDSTNGIGSVSAWNNALTNATYTTYKDRTTHDKDVMDECIFTVENAVGSGDDESPTVSSHTMFVVSTGPPFCRY